MKQISNYSTRILVLIASLFSAISTVAKAPATLPLITIDDAPLLEVIRTLARQAELNYIVDPHVPGACCGPASRLDQPTISQTWTNVTAHAALNSLLKQHELIMVTNSATTVTRIAPAKLDVQPVPSSLVGTNESKIIPLMSLDSVPIAEALTTLGSMIGLDISFNAKLAPPAFDLQGTVTLRWERITARQALAALLDNYGLVMKENLSDSTALITLKPN